MNRGGFRILAQYSRPPVGYAGNGNVLTANDSENGNWTYGYDSVNRLQTATATASGQTVQNFTYTPDAWGNMTCSNSVVGGLPCTPLGLSYSPSTTNNQITTAGYSYDAAGNLLTDNTHGYVYDAENRLTCVAGTDGTCTSASAVLYLYDADGRRVGKQQANTLEDYVYDPQGQIASMHDGSANLLRTELYAPGGRHVATLDGRTLSASYLYWNHADWLGTERVRTNSTGAIAETCTDTPYGMNLNCVTTQGDVNPMHFTGKERDSETGNDFFDARYYQSPIGRFMTTDPDNAGADHKAPQSWNMYAYVRNNPTTNIDPDGLDCISTSNRTTSSVTVTIVRGDNCSTDSSYVPGTIDEKSLTYNGSEVGYSYSDAGTGVSGAGVIAFADRPSGQLTPYAVDVFSHPSIRAASGTINNWIAPPLLAFLSFGGNWLEAAPEITSLGLLKSAAQDLRNLSGMSREAAQEVLEKSGFKPRPPTRGGYQQWVHPDGSRGVDWPRRRN